MSIVIVVVVAYVACGVNQRTKSFQFNLNSGEFIVIVIFDSFAIYSKLCQVGLLDCDCTDCIVIVNSNWTHALDGNEILENIFGVINV